MIQMVNGSHTAKPFWSCTQMTKKEQKSSYLETNRSSNFQDTLQSISQRDGGSGVWPSKIAASGERVLMQTTVKGCESYFVWGTSSRVSNHVSLFLNVLKTMWLTWDNIEVCRPPWSAPLIELERERDGVEDAGASLTDILGVFRS